MSMEPDNILSIDQGTSSTKIAIIDKYLSLLYIEQIEHDQINLNPGWTEHDPIQIYNNVLSLIDNLFKKDEKLLLSIKTIAITNQRETCLAWDKSTGKNLTNAIVWHDTRTLGIVDEILSTNQNNIDCYRDKTGLPVNTYFSAVKIKWMIDNEESIKSMYKENQINSLCFGTIDTWLIYKLTGNYYTDVTNASRTLLMNLKNLDWDEDILKEFGILRCSLPVILNSSDEFGIVREGHLKGIPITGVIGDQQSACMGHLLQIGQVKNTYGTGCFSLMNTGNKLVQSKHGLLTTVLYRGNRNTDDTLYALEGAIETAGSAINWLKNNLNVFSSYESLRMLFNTVEDNGGIVFVPAFSGLYSPHWDNTARGLLIGLNHHTKQGHIIRATYEAICLRTYEVIKSFENDSEIEVKCLVVDGGLTSSEELLQTQSNVLGIPVYTRKEREITIIGSAVVAGLEKNISIWSGIEELMNLNKVEKIYNSEWNIEKFNKLHSQWIKAVERAKNWV